MTENAKTNEVLRTLFALPITAEQRLGAFFLWGMLLPEDSRAEKKARQRDYNKQFYAENSARLKEKVNRYQAENVAARQEYDYQRYHNDPVRRADVIARAAESAKRNPEKNTEHKRRSAAKPENKAKKHARVKERREQDPLFRLLGNMRGRVTLAMKRAKKAAKTCALLGMELPEFRIYVQGQFQPGMTWENYGPVWHIDHKRPCDSFDLSDPAQQRECFHWSNLQPLFAVDNLRKGANFPS